MGNNLKGKNILWVEDDNFLGEVIIEKFREKDAEIIHINSGSKAVESLGQNTPDLIILDILLPDKDGFEILDEIKSDSELSKIPVMVLSNLSQEDTMNKAKELGADKFYVKSNLSPDQVVEKAEELLTE